MNGNTLLDPFEQDAPPADGTGEQPSTLTVVGLLVAAALIFSYLGAYCFTSALVGADVLSAWRPGEDPRPKWMAFGFVGLMTTFALVAITARSASTRQLKRIDAMEQAEGE